MIDLRSDTLTHPTPGMLDAMMSAPVGDDVLDGDPSVKKLEEKCARLLGMDAAIFCPSGTMTNQIGISILTQPYEEIICYEGAHIYINEGGGLAGNSAISIKTVSGDRGRLSTTDIENNLHDPNNHHQARTALVALENTVADAGGSCYTIEQIEQLSALARAKDLAIHLDGARLFNALVAHDTPPSVYGKYFDTISICLSKGLGTPVGSVLLCHQSKLKKAIRMRKVFGGGMRQSGYLAAAGIYALDHHIPLLNEDHKRAKIIAQALATQGWVQSIYPVDTNIIIFEVEQKKTPAQIIEKLLQHDIKAMPWGAQTIRMVTYLGIDDAMTEKIERAIKSLF